MQGLSLMEARRWTQQKDELGAVDPERSCLRLRVPVPPDSGAKTAISRELALLLRGHGEVMVLIDEYGIWPTAEDRNLFDRFRQSCGVVDPVELKPGCLFVSASVDLGSLLALILYFVWGATVSVGDGTVQVRISHDEMLEVYAADSGIEFPGLNAIFADRPTGS